MSNYDPRLVRLLSRHFNDLHGLSYALGCVAVVCFGLLLLYGGVTVAILGALALVLLLRRPMIGLDTYYRARLADHALLVRAMRPTRGVTAAGEPDVAVSQGDQQ